VNLTHSQLEDNIVGNIDSTGDGRTGDDVDGHGTAVAGVIAAIKDDFAVHGIAYEAGIYSVRADTPGTCEADGGDGCTFNDGNLATAIDDAVAAGASVINMSLGADATSSDIFSPVAAAMRRAAAAGVVIVTSAGNRDEDADSPEPNPGFPGSLAAEAGIAGFVVSVGATGQDGLITDFSYGAEGLEEYFLVAPGEDIITTYVDDDEGEEQYVRVAGTSFSAPYVAGSLALLLDAFPELTGDEALQVLFDTATDLGDPGPDAIYGMGLVDLEAAFNPVGTSSVEIGGIINAYSFESTALTSAPTGASGDWVFESGLLSGAVLRDSYDRPFQIDPERPAADISALNTLEGAANNALLQTRSSTYGATNVTMRISEPRLHALTNLPIETYGETTQLKYAAQNGRLRVEAGQGFSPRGPIDAVGTSVLSTSLFSGAVAGLTDQSDWTSMSYDAGSVSFGFRASGNDQSGFTAASALFHSGQQSFGFEMGAGEEHQSALGALIAARFGEQDSAQTNFTAALWSGPLPKGWVGAARFEYAHADIALPGVLNQISDTTASAWSMGIERTFAEGQLGFTLSQPLRVESGAVSALVAVDLDEDRNSIFERRTASLTPSGRELSFETGWSRSLNQTTQINLAARLTHEAGHIDDTPMTALAWAGIRTTW
jgi:subtilisin family serine protease